MYLAFLALTISVTTLCDQVIPVYLDIFALSLLSLYEPVTLFLLVICMFTHRRCACRLSISLDHVKPLCDSDRQTPWLLTQRHSVPTQEKLVETQTTQMLSQSSF